MNLAIDVTSIPLQPAGVGVYVINLTRALIMHAPKSGFKVFIFGRNNQCGMPEFQGARFVECGMMSRAKRILWEQTMFPLVLSRNKISLLHSPNYSIPVLAQCKRVCTIHDLTSLNFPTRRKFWHGLYFRKMIAIAARFADFILSDSENTRQDIIQYFPRARYKIKTVYPACRPVFNLPPETGSDLKFARLELGQGYFLFVSTIEPSKNLARLIEAFEMFRSKAHSNTNLVIVGKRGWNYHEVMSRIRKSEAVQGIKVLGYQEDDILVHLYKNALALIYPSLYEGFGMPPLEAMSVNTPVLASNASSIPEVVGDAALLFDPEDTNAMMLRMIEIYENNDLRRNLSAKGALRAQLFSWDMAAQETIAIYKSVLMGENRFSPDNSP